MSTKTIQLTDGTDNILPISADSGSGYCKMADGTLIQWGTATFSNSNFVFIEFPQTFATMNYVIQILAKTTSWTAPTTELFSYTTIGSGMQGCNIFSNQTSTSTVCWIAIGRWE